MVLVTCAVAKGMSDHARTREAREGKGFLLTVPHFLNGSVFSPGIVREMAVYMRGYSVRFRYCRSLAGLQQDAAAGYRLDGRSGVG